MLDDLTQIHNRDVRDALGLTQRNLSKLLEPASDSQPSLAGNAATDTKPPYSLVIIQGTADILVVAKLALVGVECSIPVITTSKTVPDYQGHSPLLIQLPLTSEDSYNFDLQGGAYAEMRALTQLLIDKGDAKMVDSWQYAASQVLEACSNWEFVVASHKNPAKSLAKELLGRSIVVIASPELEPLANWWCTLFGFTAKQVAWVSTVNSAGGSDMAGWSTQPSNTPYAVIRIISSYDSPEVSRAAIIQERLLSGLRPSAQIVELTGDTVLSQLLWGMAFGQQVSNYLALANGLDPSANKIQTAYTNALEE